MSFTKGAFFEDEDIYRQMDNLLRQFINYFTHLSIHPSSVRVTKQKASGTDDSMDSMTTDTTYAENCEDADDEDNDGSI